MSIYAIIYLVITFISLLASANQHGKQKTGEQNFWVSLVATGIMTLLLYLGGFFN